MRYQHSSQFLSCLSGIVWEHIVSWMMIRWAFTKYLPFQELLRKFTSFIQV